MKRYPVLTKPQRAILEWLRDGRAPFLHYYSGPPGTMPTDRCSTRGYAWPMGYGEGAPRVHGQTVNGLIARGFLGYIDDGDYNLTIAGEDALK